MFVAATGIVIDHYGDVLLIQRDDTRTLAPPGGSAEIGEIPTQTAAREVEEETGLLVLPVRLVGVYFFQNGSDTSLSFCYRCIMRGGKLTTSEESLNAGFFKTNPLPKPMLKFHSERINNSLNHPQNPPRLIIQEFPLHLRLGKIILNTIIYPWMDYRRRRSGKEPYQPPPDWLVTNFLVVKNQNDEVMWVESKNGNAWTLPSAESNGKEAPWETALKLVKNRRSIAYDTFDLVGVYSAKDVPEMVLIFSLMIKSGQPMLQNEQQAEFFPIGQEPPTALDQHVAWINGTSEHNEDIQYGHAN